MTITETKQVDIKWAINEINDGLHNLEKAIECLRRDYNFRFTYGDSVNIVSAIEAQIKTLKQLKDSFPVKV